MQEMSVSMQSSTARARLRKKAFAPRYLQTGAIVIVADGNGGRLAGFVCVQLKKSFCYDEYMPEITEVYVHPVSRAGRRGNVDLRAEYCKKYTRSQLRLLTGSDIYYRAKALLRHRLRCKRKYICQSR